MRKLLIRPSRCTKVRFVSSDCRKCVSVCPVDAIGFKDQSIEVNSDCIGCSFCVAVCPNEVFSAPEKSNRSVEDLSCLKHIFCSGLLSDEELVLALFPPGIIPCPGSFPAHFLLTWISKNYRPLEIVAEDCSRCGLRPGISLFQDAVSQVGPVLRKIIPGVAPVIVRAAMEEDRVEARELYRRFQNGLEEEPTFSRRDFFMGLPKRLFPGGEREGTERDRESDEGWLPERLRVVISFYRENRGPLFEGHESPFFSEIDVSSSCTGCGACARACPTDALSFQKMEGAAYLNWTPSHCTQCGLCEEVCSRDSIQLTLGLDIGKILHDSKTAVQTFGRKICSLCNREIIFNFNETDDECPYCRKEQQMVRRFSTTIYGEPGLE